MTMIIGIAWLTFFEYLVCSIVKYNELDGGAGITDVVLDRNETDS